MNYKRVQNYTIKLSQVLGRGSFGVVYKAIDDNTQQQVAIKALDKKTIQMDEYKREALKLQIRILKKIKSEHVVKFKDVLQTQNNYYIIQQYCNQGDFSHYLKKHPDIEEKQAIGFMVQILEGFYDLIRNGVVHRDIKTENILIKDGKLKIADFGLSKSVNDEDFLSSHVGTPIYQSPQLILCEKYTYKCDIWALGILFYFILFGKYPWKYGTNYKTYIQNITQKKLQFPENKPISKNLQQLIANCLRYEENDRADWPEIYNSVVFENRLPKVENLNQKLIYAINKLRISIHQSNINLQIFFKGQKLNKNSSLNLKQFKKMIGKLSSSFLDEEIQYMFTKFDTNLNGTIQLQQFRKCLQNYQVRQKSIDLRKILFAQVEDKLDKQIQDKRQRFADLSERICESMQKNQIYDLYELFVTHDGSHDGILKQNQLKLLLREIYPQINQQEMKLIFQKFDQNHDLKISFRQFYKGMCLITGTPNMALSISFTGKSK